MKVSDYIVDVLKQNGIKYVFGYQGGNITCIIDSLYREDGIDFIQNYNEQASAFAANSYSQITENFGVAIASSGPGAINLISGIANAFYDSIPCLFITGNVNSHLLKKNESLRQNTFQESDIVNIVKPITKFAVTVKNPHDICYYLDRAIFMMKTDRCGPVLLDIPHNVQYAEIENNEVPHYKPAPCLQLPESTAWIELFDKSQRPLFLIGGGANNTECKKLLKTILKENKIPVVASLLGLDIVSHDNECFCGFIGVYGNRYANMAIKFSDLIIAIGARLDDRQTGGDNDAFKNNKNIIHVDIDANVLLAFPDSIRIKSTSELFLHEFNKCIKGRLFTAWLSVIHKWKHEFSSVNYPSNSNDKINANNFIDYFCKEISKPTIICADVGQTQMSLAQAVYIKKHSRLLNSGGLGAMGYSLPAAIGASFGSEKHIAISFVGDGGFQMNIQELQTISRENLPITIVILNNNSLGMIKLYQEKTFNNRLVGSVIGYSNPNFKEIALAYGFEFIFISRWLDLSKINFKTIGKKPLIIEVLLPDESPNCPNPGVGIFDQNPPLTFEQQEKIKKDIFNENI